MQNDLSADQQVPADLVTSDFSGFDPDITAASALVQVDRVARARGLDSATVRALVEKHVQGGSSGSSASRMSTCST